MESLAVNTVFAVALGIMALGGVASATTYYVSAEGEDAADGRSTESPLQSIEAAASRVARGDTILLRRGDVFRESVEMAMPDVVVDAYGPADAPLPTIAGSMPVAGWQRHEGEVWVAETEHDVGYLYVDGEPMTIARYPNTGWLRTLVWEEEQLPQPEGEQRRRRRRPRTGRTYITCEGLTQHPSNAEDYWVGANIRWRHHSWWFETRPVLEYDPSGVLTLGDRSFNDEGPFDWDEIGWGFYLDGKLEELDLSGEWYFDSEAGKVYLHPPGGADPNDLLIEGSVLSTGLSVMDGTVGNVAFRHQKDIGLQIDGRSVVEHCHFRHVGRDATVSERDAGGSALRATSTVRDARVRHCVFEDNFNHGITWYQGRETVGSSIIERNVLRNTGVVEGYGGSGSWHAVAVCIATGSGVHVRYNRIDGSGYAGILFGRDGNFAEYNVIVNAMATLNDGAGIYTNCSRSTIRGNIILDCPGGMESSGTWETISHGIWLEFLRNYRESVVEGNTCARSGGEGIFLPNNYACVVRGNVLYGNKRHQMLLTGYPESDRQESNEQGHLIVGNVLYATSPEQGTLYFDPTIDYGTLRANTLCNPFTEAHLVEGNGWPRTGPERQLTLEQWQAEREWADAEVRTDLEKLPAGEGADCSELFINDTEEPKVIELEGTWRDLAGSEVIGSLTLQPFSSAILVRAETGPLPGPTAGE